MSFRFGGLSKYLGVRGWGGELCYRGLMMTISVSPKKLVGSIYEIIGELNTT